MFQTTNQMSIEFSMESLEIQNADSKHCRLDAQLHHPDARHPMQKKGLHDRGTCKEISLESHRKSIEI